ncbi:hypothetical protein JM654_23645 [Microbacterium oxydans]|nr:hypothetical protein [Microbacterium oxydans]
MLDVGDDAVVYLGTKEGIDPAEMLQELATAQDSEHPFPRRKYVNSFPARKHDHFAIPAGTVHCSGANSMVLESLGDAVHLHLQALGLGPGGTRRDPRPCTSTTAPTTSSGTATPPGSATTSSTRSRPSRTDGDVIEESTGLHSSSSSSRCVDTGFHPDGRP